jgi:hypothetical protein
VPVSPVKTYVRFVCIDLLGVLYIQIETKINLRCWQTAAYAPIFKGRLVQDNENIRRLDTQLPKPAHN